MKKLYHSLVNQTGYLMCERLVNHVAATLETIVSDELEGLSNVLTDIEMVISDHLFFLFERRGGDEEL